METDFIDQNFSVKYIVTEEVRYGNVYSHSQHFAETRYTQIGPYQYSTEPVQRSLGLVKYRVAIFKTDSVPVRNIIR